MLGRAEDQLAPLRVPLLDDAPVGSDPASLSPDSDEMPTAETDLRPEGQTAPVGGCIPADQRG